MPLTNVFIHSMYEGKWFAYDHLSWCAGIETLIFILWSAGMSFRERKLTNKMVCPLRSKLAILIFCQSSYFQSSYFVNHHIFNHHILSIITFCQSSHFVNHHIFNHHILSIIIFSIITFCQSSYFHKGSQIFYANTIKVLWTHSCRYFKITLISQCYFKN